MLTFAAIIKRNKGGKMKIRPLYDRVIILPEGEENVTSSGIVLPSTAQERPEKGTVVAVGDGDDFDGNRKEMKVKVGDKVIFNKYAGEELKIEDKTHIILREIDIIGVEE